MGVIEIILLVVFILSAIILVVLVLMQDEQGEGLGGIFGGSSSTAFGSRSGNVLTKFTAILGGIFLFCSFGLAWVNKTPEAGDVLGAARRQATEGEAVEEWWEVEETEQGIQQQQQQAPEEEVKQPEAAEQAETERAE
jgi:preprotein translocase subunit SecG